jgi:hypothetical protein
VKISPLLLALASLAVSTSAFAQGSDSIKATTKLRGDGSKVNTVIDPEQHTSVETVLDAKDRVIRKTTYLLDEKNLAMGAIHYDANGKMRYQEAYQRDSAGQLVEMRFTSPEGKYLGRRVYTLVGKTLQADDYDAQGALIPTKKPATTSTSAARPDKKKK